jgi:hypothetical protein
LFNQSSSFFFLILDFSLSFLPVSYNNCFIWNRTSSFMLLLLILATIKEKIFVPKRIDNFKAFIPLSAKKLLKFLYSFVTSPSSSFFSITWFGFSLINCDTSIDISFSAWDSSNFLLCFTRLSGQLGRASKRKIK